MGNSSPEETLVVVNMAKWPNDFIVHNMYCCPATEDGFAKGYVHRPAKWIGNYVSKGVPVVALVEACVRLRSCGNHDVLWGFGTLTDEDAVKRALEVRGATGRNLFPCLVFLQSNLRRTDFKYDPSGGMQSSRQYFDLGGLGVNTVEGLASLLNEHDWSSLRAGPLDPA